MIVGIGNPVYDLIQTPHINRPERILSGCSTNACLVASKLGKRATLVGRLSSDYVDQFIRDMRRFTIEHVIYLSEETGGFRLIYDDKGDRTLNVLGNAGVIEAFPDIISSAEFVLVGPILGETPPSLIKSIARATVAPLILDPQGFMRRILKGRINRYRNPELDEVLPYFDVVKANEYETQILTGFDPRNKPIEAVVKMYEMMHAAPRRVDHRAIAIATLAEAGSIIFDGNEILHIPAYSVDAIDPTGAGDTYAGGFMVQFNNTPDDLRLVGCFASATASVMVENSGPDFLLTNEEVHKRTAHLLEQVNTL